MHITILSDSFPILQEKQAASPGTDKQYPAAVNHQVKNQVFVQRRRVFVVKHIEIDPVKPGQSCLCAQQRAPIYLNSRTGS